MNWFFLALLSGAIMAAVELFDKFVLDNEVKNPFLSALFCKLPIFVVFTAVGLVFGSTAFSPLLFGASFGLVGLYIVSSYFYYAGIQKEEVSRFIPTLSLNTVFIVLISFILLNERFGAVTYGGAMLTIAGSFLISMEKPGRRVIHNFQSSKAIMFALGAAFLWAVRDVSLKFLTSQVEIFTMLFWIGTVGTPVTLLIVFSQKSQLEKGRETGYEHLMLIGLLVSAGYLAFLKAINTGPVSLASVVAKIDSALVFIGSALATFRDPEDFHENLDRKVMIQKAVSLVMILAGVAIINLF